MTTWNNGRVHDLLEPGSPQERLGTRLVLSVLFFVGKWFEGFGNVM